MQNFSSKMFVLISALSFGQSIVGAAHQLIKGNRPTKEGYRSVAQLIPPAAHQTSRALSPHAASFVPSSAPVIEQPAQPVVFVPIALYTEELHIAAAQHAALLTRYPLFNPREPLRRRLRNFGRILFNNQRALHELNGDNIHRCDLEIKKWFVAQGKELFPADAVSTLRQQTVKAVVTKMKDEDVAIFNKYLRALRGDLPDSLVNALRKERGVSLLVMRQLEMDYEKSEIKLLKTELANAAKDRRDAKALENMVREATTKFQKESRTASGLSIVSSASGDETDDELRRATLRRAIETFH
jgi:hypothetical protein